MKVLGIDPGAGGAMTFIDDGGIKIWDVPFIEVDGKWIWNYRKIYGILNESNEDKKIDLCVLEKAHAMHAQGVTSVFTYGESYGAYKMALAVSGIHPHTVTPLEWQHHFDIRRPKGDKRYNTKIEAAKIVEKLYPDLEIRTKIKTASTGRITGGKLMDGRSDSVCLALYAMYLLKREAK